MPRCQLSAGRRRDPLSCPRALARCMRTSCTARSCHSSPHPSCKNKITLSEQFLRYRMSQRQMTRVATDRDPVRRFKVLLRVANHPWTPTLVRRHLLPTCRPGVLRIASDSMSSGIGESGQMSDARRLGARRWTLTRHACRLSKSERSASTRLPHPVARRVCCRAAARGRARTYLAGRAQHKKYTHMLLPKLSARPHDRPVVPWDS
ncbi:hypothetical protein OH77DRAFT_1263176 [Trametes cingulata]|nr:hypothetical protein OH77DRAFT_1263176 [Trametes cingulata]